MRRLVVVGINHRTAPLEIREKLSFSERRLEEYLESLRQTPAVIEGMLLSTCNRVEIYAASAAPERCTDQLIRFMVAHHGLSEDDVRPSLYVHYGKDVVHHIFRVASSLDSMVVGEPQILGQIKDAYRVAHAESVTGRVLNKLLHKTFSVAKRVRTETQIGDRAISVSFVAVELTKKIFGKLEGREVLVIGAGEMCELACRHLIASGVRRVVVTNRTEKRAEEMAQQFGGETIPFDRLYEALLRVDIVVSSTASSTFVLSKDIVSQVIKTRKNKPLFFIDIAVPRDVDPEVNTIDNVYLYDIDDLREVAEANMKNRGEEAQRAESIVDAEVEVFWRWSQAQDVTPVIVALRDRVDQIRKNELDKTLRGLGQLGDREREALDTMTASIVNKILHKPISALKQTRANSDATYYLEAIRELFGLKE